MRVTDIVQMSHGNILMFVMCWSGYLLLFLLFSYKLIQLNVSSDHTDLRVASSSLQERK